MRAVKSVLFCLGLLLAPTLSALAGELAATYPLAALDGSARTVSLQPGERALVFVFLSVECPIANRCLPELRQLAGEFATNGVRFLHIYAQPDETDEAIRQHRREFALEGEAFRDPQHRLAERFNARTTPEVVAVAADGGLIYQGRVNDQYAALGRGKPAPTKHDFAEALRDFLSSGKPRAVRTRAVGCTFRAEP